MAGHLILYNLLNFVMQHTLHEILHRQWQLNSLNTDLYLSTELVVQVLTNLYISSEHITA